MGSKCQTCPHYNPKSRHHIKKFTGRCKLHHKDVNEYNNKVC
jgi:hypothetical protein